MVVYAIHLVINYIIDNFILVSGVDPGFLERGFKFTEGGSICKFYLFIYLIFLKR